MRQGKAATKHDCCWLAFVRRMNGRVVCEVERGQVALPVLAVGGAHRLEVGGDPLVEDLRLAVDRRRHGRRRSLLNAKPAEEVVEQLAMELSALVVDESAHGAKHSNPMCQDGRCNRGGLLVGDGDDADELGEGARHREDVAVARF